jgi:hypothetical protein
MAAVSNGAANDRLSRLQEKKPQKQAVILL